MLKCKNCGKIIKTPTCSSSVEGLKAKFEKMATTIPLALDGG